MSYSDSGKPDLAVGLRLWRPVSINFQYGHKIETELSKEARSDRGSLVLSAVWGSGYCTDGWVIMARMLRSRGFICFCNAPVSELWTYFEIIRMNQGNKSAMVRPVNGDVDELIAQYHAHQNIMRYDFISHPLLAQGKAPV